MSISDAANTLQTRLFAHYTKPKTAEGGRIVQAYVHFLALVLSEKETEVNQRALAMNVREAVKSLPDWQSRYQSLHTTLNNNPFELDAIRQHLATLRDLKAALQAQLTTVLQEDSDDPATCPHTATELINTFINRFETDTSLLTGELRHDTVLPPALFAPDDGDIGDVVSLIPEPPRSASPESTYRSSLEEHVAFLKGGDTLIDCPPDPTTWAEQCMTLGINTDGQQLNALKEACNEQQRQQLWSLLTLFRPMLTHITITKIVGDKPCLALAPDAKITVQLQAPGQRQDDIDETFIVLSTNATWQGLTSKNEAVGITCIFSSAGNEVALVSPNIPLPEACLANQAARLNIGCWLNALMPPPCQLIQASREALIESHQAHNGWWLAAGPKRLPHALADADTDKAVRSALLQQKKNGKWAARQTLQQPDFSTKQPSQPRPGCWWQR